MALIYISRMVNDAKHLFRCLFAICLSFLVKHIFLSFFYFLSGLFLFVLLFVFWEFFTYLRCKSFTENVFFKGCSLSFFPLFRVLHKANTSNFDNVCNVFLIKECDKIVFLGDFLHCLCLSGSREFLCWCHF